MMLISHAWLLTSSRIQVTIKNTTTNVTSMRIVFEFIIAPGIA